MDSIIIKKKVFNIVSQIGERTFKCEYNNKFYFVKNFGFDKTECKDFLYRVKKISFANINIPKLDFIDKKQCIVALDFIERENPFNKLIDGDLDEEYYKELFLCVRNCKKEHIQLDYNPNNFRFKDGKLFYLPFKFKEYIYDYNFIDYDVKVWFYTKEFSNLVLAYGFNVDKDRLKNEFEINKKMTLMAIKYF